MIARFAHCLGLSRGKLQHGPPREQAGLTAIEGVLVRCPCMVGNLYPAPLLDRTVV